MSATRSPISAWPKAPRWLPALLLALGLAGAAAPARAQQVLLQTNVATDTIPPRTGPNRAWFGHTYLGYALVAGESDLGLDYGLTSWELLLGGRLKRRLGGAVALCADLRYAYLRYGLDANVDRPAPFLRNPDANQHLAYHQVQGELSLRLNPGRRRGNTVGRYVDLLTYGGPAVSTTYAAELPIAGGGRSEQVEHGPAYMARWLGGVGVRVGSNSLALVGRYRLSEALTRTNLPEPPRLTLGFEVGWF